MTTLETHGPEPAELAAACEREHVTLAGPGHRFAGYAVLGAPFRSGDVLALRRFPATSIGDACTTVWHRAPDGRWMFYSDLPAGQGCSRYFGPALDDVVVSPIRLEWVTPRQLRVAVDGGRILEWSLVLAPSPGTVVLNALCGVVPDVWRTRPWVLHSMGLAASSLLAAGRIRFSGRTPSGARFRAIPRRLWAISVSRAVVDGRDLGASGPIDRQVALGDFWLPQRGLFATALVSMFESDQVGPAGIAGLAGFDSCRESGPSLAGGTERRAPARPRSRRDGP